MIKILFVAGLIGFAASMNAGAIEPQSVKGGTYSASCTYDHPDMPSYIGNELPLDVKGAVRSVKILENKDYKLVNYFIDKNGFVTDKVYKCNGGQCQSKFEYDSSGRIKRATESLAKLGETIREYTYLDEKDMAIYKEYNNRKVWLKTSATIRSVNADGNSVCYSLFSTKTSDGKSNHFGAEYTLSQDKSLYTKGKSLFVISKIKINTDADADASMLSMLNCLKQDICPNDWKPDSWNETRTKSNEGEFQKFYNERASGNEVYWFKNGLIDEETGMYKKISDGTQPHGIYKYQYDPIGNWIKREKYINDIPATLTDDKPKYRKVDEETVIRKIEYYN